jgi:hypothetical protein
MISTTGRSNWGRRVWSCARCTVTKGRAHLFDRQSRRLNEAGAEEDAALVEGQAEDQPVSIMAGSLQPPSHLQGPRPVAQEAALQLWWELPLDL